MFRIVCFQLLSQAFTTKSRKIKQNIFLFFARFIMIIFIRALQSEEKKNLLRRRKTSWCEMTSSTKANKKNANLQIARARDHIV